MRMIGTAGSLRTESAGTNQMTCCPSAMASWSTAMQYLAHTQPKQRLAACPFSASPAWHRQPPASSLLVCPTSTLGSGPVPVPGASPSGPLPKPSDHPPTQLPSPPPPCPIPQTAHLIWDVCHAERPEGLPSPAPVSLDGLPQLMHEHRQHAQLLVAGQQGLEVRADEGSLLVIGGGGWGGGEEGGQGGGAEGCRGGVKGVGSG